MNDVEIIDLNKKIALNLIEGMTPKKVSEYLGCDISAVNMVFQSKQFVALATDQLSSNVRSASVSALKNIVDISNDKKASDATRLKASQYIVDKALEFKDAARDDNNASAMTQEQLSKRYEEFEAELAKRSKVVEVEHLNDTIEDMY